MDRSKLILGLLTLVTIGMMIGALFQLAFIHRLEESSGTYHLENDKEATVLRLGYSLLAADENLAAMAADSIILLYA